MNNVLDINIENDVDNLNVSQSTLTENQVQNNTNSPVSASHCTNDGNLSKVSKDQSKDNILTDIVSNNENIKEKSNAYSARSIESPITQKCNVVLKVNTEQKNTNLKIKSPQVERASILPTVINSYGQKIFRFYWLDAYEDSYTDPGVVFLFGRVLEPKSNQPISCCVTVKNVPRRIYVLPRRNVSCIYYYILKI